jgi:hypothetical protein
LPQPNTDGNAKCDRDSHGYTSAGDTDTDSYNHTTARDADCDAHTHGDPAFADAKAAAHAVSSADAMTASE